MTLEADREERAFNIKLGQSIRLYRLAIGLTQTDLASKIGVTFQTVQKYETGVIGPTAARLARLSAALGVTVNLILDLPEPTADPVEAVGERLRQVRKAAGLSLSAVAERAKTKKQNVSQLERGDSELKIRTLVEIASALGCHPAEILDPELLILSPEETAWIRRRRAGAPPES